MPPKPWKTLTSRLVYENPWTRVREAITEMPNGKATSYGVIESKDCVGVLPFLDDGHVVLVRQYRYVSLVIDSEIRDSMTTIAVLRAVRSGPPHLRSSRNAA